MSDSSAEVSTEGEWGNSTSFLKTLGVVCGAYDRYNQGLVFPTFMPIEGAENDFTTEIIIFMEKFKS